MDSRPDNYSAALRARRWLSHATFELALDRPAAFTFRAGQKIRINHGGASRDYSLVSAPQDTHLKLCIRLIPNGRLSAELSRMPTGADLAFSGPRGYFTFKPSPRKPVFIATGTGIAPFVAMARAGIDGFILLHGVRQPDELYYRPELEAAAGSYIPCISEQLPSSDGSFSGRVTDFLNRELAPAAYDFYLCGGGTMIRDVMFVADERFQDSLIYTEKFY